MDYIPNISDERLQVLAKRIQPVVRMTKVKTTTTEHEDGSFTLHTKPDPEGEWSTWEDGKLYYIEEVANLRRVSYTWSPKPSKPVEEGSLNPLTDIRTYHTWAYYGFFKPTIAEVLAQIPESQIEDVVAFEIIDSPKTAADLNKESVALNDGYHVATTRLYANK